VAGAAVADLVHGEEMNKVEVYLDDGRVFTREMKPASEAYYLVEIIRTKGYSHWTGKVWEIYPLHRTPKIPFTSAGPDHEPFDDVRFTTIQE
jgi:hypothetical protein